MNCYIKRLSYLDATKAVDIINGFARERMHDSSISLEERLSWDAVYANISMQSVALIVDNEAQIESLNVLLYDNNLGSIDFELPFIMKSPSEKAEIIKRITNQPL